MGAATAVEIRHAANERVRELAGAAGEETEGDWEFFCECGDPACTEMVRLRADDFDLLTSGRVLADGHGAVSLRVDVARAGILDAAEDLERLLDAADDLELSPACRELVIALDEAVTRDPGQSSSGRTRSTTITASRTASGATSAQSATRPSSALPATPPPT